MPRATIRQRWSVIALIALNRTGMRAPVIFRRIRIPRRAVYGVLRRHAVRPNEVTGLPRSGRPRKGLCQQWLQTGRSWHYGGLTAQKYTDHILLMSHTLIIMHWQIYLPSSQDKRGVSCQCGDLCPPVANKGSGYQYYWEHIWSYISRRINGMNQLPRNTTGLRAAVHNESQSVTQARIRRFSDQRCTPIRSIVQALDWHVNY